MSIDEQIENLESLGLLIQDKDRAREILNDISYFRLIKAFSLHLKPRNGNYMEGVTLKNFCEEYEGGDLPFYALVEILSFGTLSKVFKNMKSKDKKNIAQIFGVGYTYLESWIENLSYVRNICAHYGRLYNAKFSKTPKLYKEYQKQKISNNRIFGTLVCLKHLLYRDKHWEYFIDELENLFEEYESVDKSTMGFPDNWNKVLRSELKS